MSTSKVRRYMGGSHNVLRGVPLALAFVAIGFFGLQASHAATFASASEAEGGAKTGNYTSGDITGASGSAAVKFGTTVVTPPPTPGACDSAQLAANTLAGPGTVGFKGDTNGLTIVNSSATAPAGTTWNDTYKYLRVNDQMTLSCLHVMGSIDYYGAGTLTVKDSIVETTGLSWFQIYGRTAGCTLDIHDTTIKLNPAYPRNPANHDGQGAIDGQCKILAYRNDLSGDALGFGVSAASSEIVQNYIHNLVYWDDGGQNSHNNCAFIYGGNNSKLNYNYCRIGFDGKHESSAFIFQGDNVNFQNIQIIGNNLMAGGYTLRPQNGSGYVIRDNIFDTSPGGFGDYTWGMGSSLPTYTTWTNNKHSNGTVINPPY